MTRANSAASSSALQTFLTKSMTQLDLAKAPDMTRANSTSSSSTLPTDDSLPVTPGESADFERILLPQGDDKAKTQNPPDFVMVEDESEPQENVITEIAEHEAEQLIPSEDNVSGLRHPGAGWTPVENLPVDVQEALQRANERLSRPNPNRRRKDHRVQTQGPPPGIFGAIQYRLSGQRRRDQRMNRAVPFMIVSGLLFAQQGRSVLAFTIPPRTQRARRWRPTMRRAVPTGTITYH